MKQEKLQADFVINNIRGIEIKSKQVAEIIGSDGRFIAVYERKFINNVLAMDKDPTIGLAKLIRSLIKIDDKRPTLEEILDLNYEDLDKILKVLNPT